MHVYADDTDLYLPFKSEGNTNEKEFLGAMESYRLIVLCETKPIRNETEPTVLSSWRNETKQQNKAKTKQNKNVTRVIVTTVR